MPKRKICFFGLGVLGGAVARRLTACGYHVSGFDPDVAAQAAAESHGIVPGHDGHIAEADFILTSLPDDNAVKSVLAGERNILARMHNNTVVIELSTALPATVRDIATAAAKRHIAVIDCPVSGGPAEALAGKLTLLVGAAPEAIQAAEGVLTSLGEIQHVGVPGDGKTVKIVNNVMSMGNVAVAAEAFTLGVKAGMDPKRLFEVLSKSGGRSAHFLKRFPKVLERDFRPGFSAAMGEKDLRLALAMMHEFRSPGLIAALVHQLYEMTCSSFAAEDIVAIIKIFEREAGLC